MRSIRRTFIGSSAVAAVALAAIAGASVAPAPDLGIRPVAAADSVSLVLTGDIHYGHASVADAYGREDAQLTLGLNPDYVVPVGDWVDGRDSPTQYADKVDPDWGALKPRFRPTIGNHEYENPTDYDTYFPPSQRTWGSGNETNEDYWSWDTANGWHVASLNMNLSLSQGSAQYNWLAADLAANRGKPTIIVDHLARYSDGMRGDQPYLAPVWALALQQKADLFISAHDHGYQRWQRLNNSKQADPNGVRQLLVGVGGYGDNSVYGLPYNSTPLREFATVAYHGVVKLTLHPNSYDIEFYRVPSEGGGIVDAVYDQPVLNVRQTGPDTTPPSVPGTLTATAAGPNTINLAWAASTDNVGVAGYTVYRDGTAVTTVSNPGLNYADGGLVPGTTYTYAVDAFDGAGNHSATSTPASATTSLPDTVPPSTPSGLTATTLGSTTVRLAWNASSDNVAVTGYVVNRDGAAIATVGAATLTFDDTGLAPASTHTYSVVAVDAAGNRSGESPPVTATTSAAAPVQFVQAATVTTGSRVTAVNLALKPVAAGDLLVGWFGQYRSSGQVHVSDPINGAWTRAGPATTYGSGGDIGLYYVASTRSAPSGLTVTISADSATYLSGTASEYSGVASVAPLDTGMASSGTGRAVSSGSASSIAGGELVYGALTTDNNPGVIAGGPGFTLRTSHDTTAAEDILTSQPGPVSSRFTLTSSTRWHAVVAAFRARAADTASPTVPTGVAATLRSTREVDVSWSASTDNVGVTGYTVYRNGSAVTTTSASTLSYQDRSAADLTTYSYTVDALDAAGNRSAQSTPAVVTTPDWTAPTTPIGLTANAISTSEVHLTWKASADNVAVAGYTIQRNGATLTVVGSGVTSWKDPSVTPATTYSYSVDSFDAAGNHSSWSTAATCTTPAPSDTQPPSTPANVAAVVGARGEVVVSWSASTDDVGVTSYTVYRNGTALAQTSASSLRYEDMTVADISTYGYTVEAFDAAGNRSGESAPVLVTTPDWTPPTTPAGLVATVMSSHDVDLTWNQSTDNVAVSGYAIYRNGALLAGVSGSTLTYQDTTTTDGRTYSYAVDAFDAAGNHSVPSTAVSVFTPDVTPPSVPTGLAATASSPTQVQVSWQASSDNVGVSGYTVYRDGAVLASVAGGQLGFGDTVGAGSTHTYTVDAVDGAGNRSPSPPAVTVTTPSIDTTPPTSPAGLTASALSSSSVRLNWIAASDNVGVTGYTIYRDGGALATVGATALTFTDATVAAGADYTYAVDAFDAAANHSTRSAGVTVHVPGTTRFVQGKVVATGSRVTSVTVTFGAVSRGDLLVGAFGQYDATGQVTVSDNVNGAWTRSVSTTWRGSSGTPGDVALYYFANSAAAPAGLTITISAPNATYLQGGPAEYSGVAAVNPLDGAAIAKGSSTMANSGSTPAAQSGELVYAGLVATNGPGTVTAGSSQGVAFVKRAQTTSGTQAEEDILSSCPGPQQGVFTFATSVPWFAVCAVFRPA